MLTSWRSTVFCDCSELTAEAVLVSVTGPETASVRDIATRLATLLQTAPPTFRGQEADTALLSNASRAWAMFGQPQVPLDLLLRWVAEWLSRGGSLLDKPTGFEKRDGRF